MHQSQAILTELKLHSEREQQSEIISTKHAGRGYVTSTEEKKHQKRNDVNSR
jgi:hypothetical protein